MILRKLLYYILPLAIICSAGCGLDERLYIEEGTASLVIHIKQSGDADSKAVLSNEDDKKINTLSVWLVNGAGTILKTSFTSPKSASATVEFNTVPRGDHKLYIVANYTGLDSKTSGSIDDSFLNTALGEIISGSSPEFTSDQGIPCSLIKDVAISAGVNTIDAHLIRSVGRLSIAFRNLVPDKDLYIGNVFLSKRNQSKGYLFYKDDHSNPDGSENLYFPDLGESDIKKISAGGTAVVYDTYLYETSLEPSTFKVQFSGGFYPAPSVKPGYTVANTITSYNIGVNINNYDNSSKYLIRHFSHQDKFLGVDDSGTSLVLKTYDNDEQIKSDGDIERCLWMIDSEGRVRSVKYENKYLLLNSNSVSLGEKNTNTVIGKGAGGVYLYYKYDDTRYFNIKSNATGVVMGPYSNSSIWYLRKVNEVLSETHPYKKFTNPEVELNFANVYPVNYIDKYGLPQPLQHICRNEHIDLTVNVSHNTATGTFDFKVAGWKVKNLGTQFN